MTMAPASSSFCNDGALAFGRTLRSAGVPPVVGSAAVLMLSLTTIGKPASGGSVWPESRIASMRCAVCSAPARSITISAFRSCSASALASSVRM